VSAKKIRRHARYAAADEVLVELIVPLPRDADTWHDFEAEALWAEDLGEGRYLLRSAPFLAFDLAVEDVVTADMVGAERVLTGVAERGGGSCYRLHVPGGAERAQSRLDALEELDVSAEVDGEWVALDVPAQTDLEEVYVLLSDGEEAEVWTFDEGWAVE
jgi:hypothetical protein